MVIGITTGLMLSMCYCEAHAFSVRIGETLEEGDKHHQDRPPPDSGYRRHRHFAKLGESHGMHVGSSVTKEAV